MTLARQNLRQLIIKPVHDYPVQRVCLLHCHRPATGNILKATGMRNLNCPKALCVVFYGSARRAPPKMRRIFTGNRHNQCPFCSSFQAGCWSNRNGTFSQRTSRGLPGLIRLAANLFWNNKPPGSIKDVMGVEFTFCCTGCQPKTKLSSTEPQPGRPPRTLKAHTQMVRSSKKAQLIVRLIVPTACLPPVLIYSTSESVPNCYRVMGGVFEKTNPPAARDLLPFHVPDLARNPRLQRTDHLTDNCLLRSETT